MSAAAQWLLEVRDLRVEFEGHVALAEVSFGIAPR